MPVRAIAATIRSASICTAVEKLFEARRASPAASTAAITTAILASRMRPQVVSMTSLSEFVSISVATTPVATSATSAVRAIRVKRRVMPRSSGPRVSAVVARTTAGAAAARTSRPPPQAPAARTCTQSTSTATSAFDCAPAWPDRPGVMASTTAGMAARVSRRGAPLRTPRTASGQAISASTTCATATWPWRSSKTLRRSTSLTQPSSGIAASAATASAGGTSRASHSATGRNAASAAVAVAGSSSRPRRSVGFQTSATMPSRPSSRMIPAKRRARSMAVKVVALAGRSSTSVAISAAPAAAADSLPTENVKALAMRCPSSEITLHATVLVPSGRSGLRVCLRMRPFAVGVPSS